MCMDLFKAISELLDVLSSIAGLYEVLHLYLVSPSLSPLTSVNSAVLVLVKYDDHTLTSD